MHTIIMKLKLEDMYRMKMPGDLEISPDGKIIAYTVGRMDRKMNEYVSRIYMYDGKVRAFTTGPKDMAPKFTQDGNYIIYYRTLKEGGELRRISLQGGESELVAKLDNGASSIKVDGGYVYFMSSIKEKSDDDVKRIERIPFYFNGVGFLHNRKTQIFRVPVKGGKVEKLTSEENPIGDFDVLNGTIVYSVSENEKEPFMESLYLLENGKKRKISDRVAGISSFKISPSGRKIAVFLRFYEKGYAEDPKLYMIDLKEGKYTLACEESISFGRSLNSDSRFGSARVMQWINDEELLFVAAVNGKQELMIYTHGRFYNFVGGERSIESFSYVDGKLVFIAQKMNRPGEIYIKTNRERRITNMNRYFEKLPKGESFSFESSDGEIVEGWILIPEGKGPYPAVLEIHGGPKTAYGHAFMFEFYYLLSQGFAVIFTNPRGSSGYGDDFALRIRGEFGKRDYEDLMEAIEYVKANYPVDPERLFVTGGSYGGFMTNWIVGHTSIFRAAVTQRSISNQLSFWGTSDIGPWFNSDYIGAGKDLWDGFEAYWEMSPLKYAKSIKTPLLIIHSLEDYRCPVSEAYQLFYALKMNDVPTKLVLFPGENHDLSRSGKPRHREIRLREIADWFKKYVA